MSAFIQPVDYIYSLLPVVGVGDVEGGHSQWSTCTLSLPTEEQNSEHLYVIVLLFQVHYIRNEDILELHCSYSLSVILLSVTNSEKLPSNCFHYIYECHKQMFELSVPQFVW